LTVGQLYGRARRRKADRGRRRGMEKTYEVWGIHEAVELVEAADKLGLKVVLTKTDKQLYGATFDYATMKGETYSHNSPSGYRVTIYLGEG
jgi:hypothetical protein